MSKIEGCDFSKTAQFFNNYPYTNYHELNLDWIISQINNLTEEMKNFIITNQVKFADPINWSSNMIYDPYTIVLGEDGNSYISLKYVPKGVSLTNNSYWQLISNFSAQLLSYRSLQYPLLFNKKVAFFGDSITWGDSGDGAHSQVDRPFPETIEMISGCHSYNFGIKGATFTNKSENNLMSEITNSNINDYDVIFIMFGINDFNLQSVIGNDSDTNNQTIWGSLNSALNYITSNNSDALIYLCNPTYTIMDRENSINGYRSILTSYRNVLKEFAYKNNVTYIDCLTVGANDKNLNAILADGVHFTQYGYDLLAKHILCNLGGNVPIIEKMENKWNKNLYLSVDTFGKYVPTLNNVDTGYNSWVSVTLTKGVYEFDFDYNAVCNEHTSSTFSALHIKIGDYFIVSPLGIENGKGKIKITTYIESDISGILKLVWSSDDPLMVMNKLEISNFEIRTNSDIKAGEVVKIPCGNNMTGDVSIYRKNDGSVLVSYTGQSTNTKSSYQQIFSGDGVLSASNQKITIYSNGCLGNVNSRMQLIDGIISSSVEIPQNEYVTFNFIVPPAT